MTDLRLHPPRTAAAADPDAELDDDEEDQSVWQLDATGWVRRRRRIESLQVCIDELAGEG